MLKRWSSRITRSRGASTSGGGNSAHDFGLSRLGSFSSTASFGSTAAYESTADDGADYSNSVVEYRGVSLAWLKRFLKRLEAGKLAAGVELYVLQSDFVQRGEVVAAAGTTVRLVKKTGSLMLTVKAPYPDGVQITVPKKALKAKKRSEWETEDVCLHVVMGDAKVAAEELFYVDVVGNDDVGGAYQGAYVIHARRTRFRDLVGALDAHFAKAKQRDPEDQYVWLDIFSAKQTHAQPGATGSSGGGGGGGGGGSSGATGATGGGGDDAEALEDRRDTVALAGSLHKALGKFAEAVLFLPTWEDPAPFRRAWCVWELYGVAQSGVELDVVLPPGQSQGRGRGMDFTGFVVGLVEDYSRLRVKQSMFCVKSASSGCRDARDLALIRAAVAERLPGGHGALDEAAVVPLWRWLTRSAVAAAEASRDGVRSDAAGHEFARLVQRVAALLVDRGEQYDVAVRFLEEAMAILETTRGADSVPLAACALTLGRALTSVGKLDRAAQCLQQAVAILHELPAAEAGKRRRRNAAMLAEALLSSGMLLKKQGAYEPALERLHEALALMGDADVETGSDMALAKKAEVFNAIGMILGSQAKVEEAMAIYDAALAKVEASMAQSYPLFAMLSVNKAKLLRRKGLHREALAVLEGALAKLEAAVGSSHDAVAVARVHGSLGVTLQALGRFSEAHEHLETALELQRAVNPESPDLVATLLRQGNLQQAMGQHSTALNTLGRAKALAQKHFGGGDSVLLGDILHSTGVTCHVLGDYARSMQNHRHALGIFKRQLGEASPRVAFALDGLAQNHAAMDEDDKALEYWRAAQLILEDVFGQDHARLGDILAHIAAILDARGGDDREVAVQLYGRALEIREQSVGRMHPSFASTLSSRAHALENLGDLRGALSNFQEVVDIYGSFHGPEHPDTLVAQKDLARLQRRIN